LGETMAGHIAIRNDTARYGRATDLGDG